jgi:hypothetical protein
MKALPLRKFPPECFSGKYMHASEALQTVITSKSTPARVAKGVEGHLRTIKITEPSTHTLPQERGTECVEFPLLPLEPFPLVFYLTPEGFTS